MKKYISIELDKNRNIRFGMVALMKIEEKLGRPFAQIDFENELNRRSYIYNGLESYSVRFVYARNYGAFIINVIIEKLKSGVYEVYCTVKVATLDQVTFRFNIHDRDDIPMPELVNNIEEKAKTYRAIVKFVEA